jgi:sarcosine oxidase subunit beta
MTQDQAVMAKSPMRTTFDFVVIGGGIMGCWTALHLAQAGLSVAVVEKSEIAHQGSGRNRGNVRVQLRDAAERELINRALVLWQALEDQARSTVEYRVTGNLLVSYDTSLLEDFAIEAERHRSLGYDAHVVEGAALRDLVPGISPFIAGGFLTTEDGHVNGQLATWEVARLAKLAGVHFFRGVTAESIERSKDKVTGVLTSAGSLYTCGVLVAAAGESVRLLEPLGLKVPITLALHQILVTEKVPFVTGPYLRCASPRISFCQTASGTLLLGLGPASDTTADAAHRVEPRKIEAIAAETIRLVPTLDRVNIVRSWTGLFDLTPDGRALIGPVEHIAGLWVATGFNGHGMAIAPAVTESLSQAILGRNAELSFEAFAPARFENPLVIEQVEEPVSRIGHLGNLVAPPIT